MSTHITNITGKLNVSATAPSAPKEGDRYFDTTLGVLRQYKDSTWMQHPYTTTSTTSTSTSTTSTSSSTSSSTSVSTSSSTTSTSTTL